MTPKELFDLNTKIYNEAYDGIAETMRRHDVLDLDLTKYEDDCYFPSDVSVFVWDDVEGRPISARVTAIHLVPNHIEFEFCANDEGGTVGKYLFRANECYVTAEEMMSLYSVVDTIFE